MIDLLLLLVFAIVIWTVASEGAWGAGLTLLAVLFSGLVAMCYYEALAALLERQIPAVAAYSDLVALVGLFAAAVTGVRLGAEKIMPMDVEMDARLGQGLRWLFAAGAAYVTTGFLLTAMHTAPLPREFLGFSAERANFFGQSAPDRQWLAFTQYATEKVFTNGRPFDLSRHPAPGSQRPMEWSNFVIRYATRREELSGRLFSRPAATSSSSPSTPPDGNSGGGSGGKAPAGF